jgi:hypothetical protein
VDEGERALSEMTGVKLKNKPGSVDEGFDGFGAANRALLDGFDEDAPEREVDDSVAISAEVDFGLPIRKVGSVDDAVVAEEPV